jgi:hypothetical protein
VIVVGKKSDAAHAAKQAELDRIASKIELAAMISSKIKNASTPMRLTVKA